MRAHAQWTCESDERRELGRAAVRNLRMTGMLEMTAKNPHIRIAVLAEARTREPA
jgi:hypothetical protein